MDAILAVLEKAGRYLLTIRITDLLDIAIMAYLVYKLLSLVKSTRAANILKGVAIFLAALWLSSVLELRSVNYLLSHMVSVGVLALMILFQPELRQILEQIGSKNIRLLRVFAPEDLRSKDGEGEAVFLHIRTLFYPKTLHNASVFVIFSG